MAMISPIFVSVFAILSLCNGVCNQRHGVNHDRRAVHGGSLRELKVATYNVEWAWDGTTPWAAFPNDVWRGNIRAYYTNNGNAILNIHIRDIAAYIRSLNNNNGADIVMIQELADCDTLEAINAELNNGGNFGYLPWLPGNQGPGQKVGMLTRIDPIVAGGNIVNYAGNNNKGLMAIIPVWGQNFHIYGVHFTAMPNAHRQRDNDARVLEAHYSAHLPNVIVAGDFNGRKQERASGDSNPFTIDDNQQTTYNDWLAVGGAQIIRFWYSQAPITQLWQLVQLNDGAGQPQLGITDADFTEAYGKRMSQIVYHQAGNAINGEAGQHPLNCATEILCRAHLTTACTAQANRLVRIVSITFVDALNVAHPVKIAGNYVRPAINFASIAGSLCNPWAATQQFNARSVKYLRTWTMGVANNQLEITADDTPAARQTGDGVPKTHFFIRKVEYHGGVNSNINNAATAVARLDTMANAAPASVDITLRRVDEYATRLVGLTDADTNGLGNAVVNGEWTHWDCNGILAGNAVNVNGEMNTLDYIWYGTGFGAGINPQVDAVSTSYIHTANHHCIDLVHNPPHNIYSDHDPIMVGFRQRNPPFVAVHRLPPVDREGIRRRHSFSGAHMEHYGDNQNQKNAHITYYEKFNKQYSHFNTIQILSILAISFSVLVITCIAFIIGALCGIVIIYINNILKHIV